jgi:SAM-dependent methyltransferase
MEMTQAAEILANVSARRTRVLPRSSCKGLDAAEFDKFAEEYLAIHSKNIRISGEDPEYFARYKIEEVRRRWSTLHLPEPRKILDFGAGVGNSWPFLAKFFPDAEIVGVDVSKKSLAIAERRFPGTAHPLIYDGLTIPMPDQSIDLIFSSCVFHHIDAAEHVRLFRELRRVLNPTGRMIIFEHNPINPVTNYMVATCPFDEKAVLIHSGEFTRRQIQAGFTAIEVTYTGFFPRALAAFRRFERHMGLLPIGAQYYTMACA